jgi:hypothetical protein
MLPHAVAVTSLKQIMNIMMVMNSLVHVTPATNNGVLTYMFTGVYTLSEINVYFHLRLICIIHVSG